MLVYNKMENAQFPNHNNFGSDILRGWALSRYLRKSPRFSLRPPGMILVAHGPWIPEYNFCPKEGEYHGHR
jgi:hypothetical protein